MALTGSGTAADPYIVHDWDEFSAKANESEKYVKLANDIQAPSDSVSLEILAAQIDGDEYSINGLTCTSGYCLYSNCQNNSMTIKNIKFTNINMNGGDYFLKYTPKELYGYKKLTVSNISFSGMFKSGMLTNDGTYTSAQYAQYLGMSINGMAVNAEIYNSDFQMIGYLDDWYRGQGAIYNINAKLKYMGCSPSTKLFGDSNPRIVQDSLFNVDIPSTGAKLNISITLNDCCIIGKGSGIIIDSASGVNVVENTIPPETELSNVHSLTTAQIKNAQYLHDLGFPIGVN